MSDTQKISGIVLGVGAANSTKDGRIVMCAILLSEELGLIRVYPIPGDQLFRVWQRMDVIVARTPKDTRAESYRLQEYAPVGDVIEHANEKRAILNRCVLNSGTNDPLDYQNELRRSICLVKPGWGELGASMRQQSPADNGRSRIMTQSSAHVCAHIEWSSMQGKMHTSKLVAREVYEGIRRNPTAPSKIFENMQLHNPDYERWLLMGNTKDRRNVWVCVHVHRLKKNALSSTQCFLPILDGKSGDWPYCAQEETNVRVAENQLDLFTTDATETTPFLGNTAMMN